MKTLDTSDKPSKVSKIQYCTVRKENRNESDKRRKYIVITYYHLH